MKSFTPSHLSLVLVLAICVPALGAVGFNVQSAAPNYNTNQLTIVGTGFGTGLPKVDLDGQSLTVVSHTATMIVADLPNFPAGSYLLTVTTGSNTSPLVLTLGAAGPQGPAGPTGPTGPQGPQGPAGVSIGYHAFNPGGVPLGSGIIQVAATSTIGTSGVYYLSGSAGVSVAPSDAVSCWITDTSTGGVLSTVGIALVENTFTATTISITGEASIGQGDQLLLVCQSAYGDDSSNYYGGGFTATLIDDANGEIHSQTQFGSPKRARPSQR